MPDSITLSNYPARELVTAGRRPGFRPVASYLDRIPLGTEVGLGPGDIALDGDPVPPRKWAQQPPPLFGPLSSGTVVRLSCC